MESLKKEVGKRFRTLRKRAGFVSAESAAEALRVSSTTVYELERGDNWLSPEMLANAAKTFNVPWAAFFESGPLPVRPAKLELFEVVAALKDNEAKALLPGFKEALSALRGHESELEPGQNANESPQEQDSG